MGVSGGIYRVVLVLHLLTVVVAFGGFIASDAIARVARRRGGAEGAAIGEAGTAVIARVVQGAFYAVPAFGIVLVLISDGAWSFDELWVSLSFLAYVVAAVLLLAVVVPASRRANRLLAGGSSAGGGGELEALGGKISTFSGVFNLLFVAILALMIFKPGT